jgi:hypothetical protein
MKPVKTEPMDEERPGWLLGVLRRVGVEAPEGCAGGLFEGDAWGSKGSVKFIFDCFRGWYSCL